MRSPRPRRPIINCKEKIPAISISSAAQELCCYLIPWPPRQHPRCGRLHPSTWPIFGRSRFPGGAQIGVAGERRLQQQRAVAFGGHRVLRPASREGWETHGEGSTSQGS